MVTLRTDSPLCRLIVLAFLDFLDSVEAAPGVDAEGLDVAKECLKEVFRLDQTSADDGVLPGLLVNLFSSRVVGYGRNIEPNPDTGTMVDTPCTNSAEDETKNCHDIKPRPDTATTVDTPCITSAEDETKNCHDINPRPDTATMEDTQCTTSAEDQTKYQNASGEILKDELFGKFYVALDKINYFSTAGGAENPVQVANAVRFFDEAYTEMEKSGKEVLDVSFFAETLKLKGNQSMQLKSYAEAIEQYTCAIALSAQNPVYYSNRAAAYTQVQRYTDAVDDCLRSIEIDPSYSKAYSRLGFAYYAQGKYKEALNDGFLKALQLDPNNESVKENISLAQQKLREQAEADRNRGSSHGQDSAWSTNDAGPFQSFSFNSSVPLDFGNIFRNMATGAQGHQAHEGAATNNAGESTVPEIRIDGNVSMPEQLSDALRSVMGVFSSQQGRPGGNPGGTGES